MSMPIRGPALASLRSMGGVPMPMPEVAQRRAARVPEQSGGMSDYERMYGFKPGEAPSGPFNAINPFTGKRDGTTSAPAGYVSMADRERRNFIASAVPVNQAQARGSGIGPRGSGVGALVNQVQPRGSGVSPTLDSFDINSFMGGMPEGQRAGFNNWLEQTIEREVSERGGGGMRQQNPYMQQQNPYMRQQNPYMRQQNPYMRQGIGGMMGGYGGGGGMMGGYGGGMMGGYGGGMMGGDGGGYSPQYSPPRPQYSPPRPQYSPPVRQMYSPAPQPSPFGMYMR
jgi:hypothetical protein